MKKFAAVAMGAAIALAGARPGLAARAELINLTDLSNTKDEIIGIVGDVNNDDRVNVSDVVTLARIVSGRAELPDPELFRADVYQDGYIDSFDLAALRSMVIYYEPTEYIYSGETYFIKPPIRNVTHSCPSQGEAKLLAFYVDFPDCQYDYLPSVEEIEDALNGRPDKEDANYPFESSRAFLERSSRGAMRFEAGVYRYTTQHPKSYYEDNAWKINLVEEVLANSDGAIDYTQFDGDADGTIDAILLSVPKAAGSANWWPAAGPYGGQTKDRFDGMNIGCVITGNSQISGPGNHLDFTRSYLHELGHCMGLPDFYLYVDEGEDFEGLHGSAGFALMDDATADFCSVSKLQLGWYRNDQIKIYDPDSGTRKFTLKNSQSPEGNCIIIPRSYVDNDFQSEYFIVDYTTLDENNDYVDRYYWWKPKGSGVRILHVNAVTSTSHWYTEYKYASGRDADTNYNNGRRFVRVLEDETIDNLYHTGDVVDGSVAGFHWYDKDGYTTVDAGVRITVGEAGNGCVTVTLSPAYERNDLSYAAE